MRGRASFALTAFLLLFLLQALATLLATLYITVHEALHPALRPLRLLPLLLPLLALAVPLLRGHLVERHTAIMGAAIVMALARIPLSLPWHWVRFTAASVIVAGGAVFLLNAVGYIARRRIAGGLAAAVTVDQLLRLAGWSWDLSMRSWWVLPQIPLSAAVVALALAWRTMRDRRGDEGRGILERRAGGLRMRGAVALSLLLFLDLHFLARPEVAAQWTGLRYEIVAVALIGAGAAATLLLLAGHGPLGVRRRTAALLVALCGTAVLLTPVLPGGAGLLLAAAGHVAALLLIARALVPAGGRRPARNASILLGLWLLASVLYICTYFPSATLTALAGGLPWLLAAVVLLLFPSVMLLPRPLETPPPVRGPVLVGGSLLVAVGLATMLSLRQRTLPVPADAGAELRVATWNVRHGFGADLTFDPGRIAAGVAAVDADVVALQEVGAGMPSAHGVDLVLYLSRRLGIPARFAATHNGTMGDAVLHRVRVDSVRGVSLSAPGDDARQAISFHVQLGGRPVRLFATRLGLSEREREAQIIALVELVRSSGTNATVVMGDLNAEADAPVLDRLREEGLTDAFALAGASGGATAPAERPVRRIDWILLKGIDVGAAAVVPGAGSDHRMVVADLRLR